MRDRFFSSAGTGKNRALSMRLPNPSGAQSWTKIVCPWVQIFYPVLGLGSGGRLLRHFQTPVLYLMNFSLRNSESQSPKKIARTAPKSFLKNLRALLTRTRVLRQIAPESSLESWAIFCRASSLGYPCCPWILGPAVHVALRAPQPREAHLFAETPFKTNTFLGSR